MDRKEHTTEEIFALLPNLKRRLTKENLSFALLLLKWDPGFEDIWGLFKNKEKLKGYIKKVFNKWRKGFLQKSYEPKYALVVPLMVESNHR